MNPLAAEDRIAKPAPRTMPDLGIGKIITTDQPRDAIHIAVAPVRAARYLAPGAPVALDGQGEARVAEYAAAIGIVDPFLRDPVRQGERFWLFLYPNTITSLHHLWTHPAFEPQPAPLPAMDDDKAEAVNWITSFAQRCEGASYLQIMDAATDYIEHGECWSQGDRFEGCYVPDEFWTHYQTITGKAVSDRGSFFSCSC